MNIPDLISYNSVSVFGLKIPIFFDEDTDLVNPGSVIRAGKIGSGINHP
jgi:hypothetical protein